jgi:hypothetical protein
MVGMGVDKDVVEAVQCPGGWLTPYRIDIDAGESEARRDFLLGLIELIGEDDSSWCGLYRYRWWREVLNLEELQRRPSDCGIDFDVLGSYVRFDEDLRTAIDLLVSLYAAVCEVESEIGVEVDIDDIKCGDDDDDVASVDLDLVSNPRVRSCAPTAGPDQQRPDRSRRRSKMSMIQLRW